MTIDVIIPAYNCCKTLGRALASLAAQTDDNFSVLVVDDCSSEDISFIIAQYMNKLKNLRCLRTEENCGVGMARQFGIDHTSGEWITFLDADDVLMPYAIEVFKIIIGGNPDMNMLHSSFLMQSIKDGKHELLKIDNGFTWMHGKLYRRAFLDKYKIRNDPRFTMWADDSFFNSMCSELTPITMNDLPMYVWTQTAGSITRKDADAGRKKMKVLIDAMYAAGLHTLRYKKDIGHLHNTIQNIMRLAAESEQEVTEEEQAAFKKLADLYEEHGVKPAPQPRKRKFRK